MQEEMENAMIEKADKAWEEERDEWCPIAEQVLWDWWGQPSQWYRDYSVTVSFDQDEPRFEAQWIGTDGNHSLSGIIFTIIRPSNYPDIDEIRGKHPTDDLEPDQIKRFQKWMLDEVRSSSPSVTDDAIREMLQ